MRPQTTWLHQLSQKTNYADLLTQTRKHAYKIHTVQHLQHHTVCRHAFSGWEHLVGSYSQTHTHTQGALINIVSGVINFHCNPINIPFNTVFWSSIVELMKSPINPELTLIQTKHSFRNYTAASSSASKSTQPGLLRLAALLQERKGQRFWRITDKALIFNGI